MHIGTIFFNPDGFTPEGEGFTLTPSLIHPRSTGTLRLRNADPEEKPVIDANYLSDAKGEDMALLVEGVKRARVIGNKMLDLLPEGGTGEGRGGAGRGGGRACRVGADGMGDRMGGRWKKMKKGWGAKEQIGVGLWLTVY